MAANKADPIPILSWRGSPLTKRSHLHSTGSSSPLDHSTGDEIGDLEEYWSKIETISHVENGGNGLMEVSQDMSGAYSDEDVDYDDDDDALEPAEYDLVKNALRAVEELDGREEYDGESYEDGADVSEEEEEDQEEVFEDDEGSAYDAVDAYRSQNKLSPRYTHGGFGSPRNLEATGTHPSAAVAEMLQALDSLKLSSTTVGLSADGKRHLATVELAAEEVVAAARVGHRYYPSDDEEEVEDEKESNHNLEQGSRLHIGKDTPHRSGVKKSDKLESQNSKPKKSVQKMAEYIIRKETRPTVDSSANQVQELDEEVDGLKRGASDADTRHRKMLSDMALKRRQDEEEAYRQYLKAQKRRKKFKEALLEKALRARESSNDSAAAAIPAGGATKSYLLQKVSSTKDDPAGAPLSEEEEKLKRKKAAAMRRKFKEEYKRVLDILMIKNQKEQAVNDDTSGKKVVARTVGAKKPSVVVANAADADASMLPVGSALSVVRRREEKCSPDSIGNGSPQYKTSSPTTHDDLLGVESTSATSLDEGRNDMGANEEDEDNKINEQELIEQKTRRLASKMQQLKIAAYLTTLAEQKKADGNKKLVQEQRAKKRAALLASRLLNEASERKLMASEDNYSVVDVPKAPEKKIRLTAAESEAIFSRLSGGQSRRSTTDESVIAVAEKRSASVTRKPPQVSSSLAKKPGAKGCAEDDDSDEDCGEKNNETIAAVLAGTAVTQQDNRRAPPAPRDFSDWKRKNSVPQDSKVFSMTGWYPCVKQALLDRGWYFNADPQSPFFDLKWSLRSCEVSLEALQPWQLTNHFLKNGAITTKVGLLRSLQSLNWFADVSPNDIIPRGYDLTNPQETLLFIDDFATQQAENILKSIYFKLTGKNMPDEEELLSAAEGAEIDVFSRPKTPRVATEAPQIDVNEAVIKACFDILDRKIRLKETDAEYLDDPTTGSSDQQAVTNLEWEILSTIDPFGTGDLPASPCQTVEATVREKLEEEETVDANLPPSQKEKLKQAFREKERIRARKEESQRLHAIKLCKSTKLVDSSILSRIHTILITLRRIDITQSGLAGGGSNCNNMWIVKPAAKSRGRGIMCFNELPKLLKYVSADTGTSTLWIVQKYMENALIVAKRKFDLRQWVLVTDWNPLTIYFYDECYARFSVEEYSTNDSSMDNLYVHLVNNSIGKNSENFHKTAEAEDGTVIEGYMWSCETFGNHLKNMYGADYMNERIRPRMKDIVKWSLMSASDMVDHRKNSWELYGFDFMVDSDFNAWLIEINSSPACDYSTKVTEKYVQKALVELLSVTLDCREYDAAPRKTRGERPDTGGWQCIYKGPLLETPVASFGADMSLKGESIKTPYRRPLPIAPTLGMTGIGSIGGNSERELGSSQKLSVSTSSSKMAVPSSNNTRESAVKVAPRPPVAAASREELQPHPSATYTSSFIRPAPVVPEEALEALPSQQHLKSVSITGELPKKKTFPSRNVPVSKYAQPPLTLDDSIDSDGDENNEMINSGGTSHFQTQPFIQLVQESLPAGNSSVSVNQKRIPKKAANVISIQPKLFTVDF